MSTDREMLELAARAAGMPLGYEPEEWEWCRHRRCLMNAPGDGNPPNFWDPADDDGDSRRLQVACEIEAGCNKRAGFAWARSMPPSGHVIKIEEWGGDMEAATRLAVLRAAAEIGRAMP